MTYQADRAVCAFLERAPTNASVSREAVPLPIAITVTPCSLDEPEHGRSRFGGPVLRRGRVNRVGCEQAAGRVDDGHLAAGAEPGVDAEHRPAPAPAGSEQRFQVGTEHFDRVRFGVLRQPRAHVALDRRSEQTLVGVGGSEGKLRIGRAGAWPAGGGGALRPDRARAAQRRCSSQERSARLRPGRAP